MSVALIPFTTLFPWPGSFIERSIIIPFKDYNNVNKYIAKEHLHCFAKTLVPSHTVYLTDTSSPDSKVIWINETYDHLNHMNLIHYNILYMNKIIILLHLYLDVLNLENIQQKYLPLIIACFQTDVDFVFLCKLFCWMSMHNISLILQCFQWVFTKKSLLVFLNYTEPIIITWARWNDNFYVLGI